MPLMSLCVVLGSNKPHIVRVEQAKAVGEVRKLIPEQIHQFSLSRVSILPNKGRIKKQLNDHALNCFIVFQVLCFGSLCHHIGMRIQKESNLGVVMIKLLLTLFPVSQDFVPKITTLFIRILLIEILISFIVTANVIIKLIIVFCLLVTVPFTTIPV